MLITRYFEQSTASGALFALIHVGSDRIVNFNKSVSLAIDENASHRHTLFFGLHPGQYRVFAYDIEIDRKFQDGIGYPAIDNDLIIYNSGS